MELGIPSGPDARWTVAIVDRNRLFRDGLRHIILSNCFSVVAEGSTLNDAGVGLDCPDLLVFSVGAQSDTAPALRDIASARTRYAAAKIVLLSNLITPELFWHAVNADVSGVLSQDTSGDGLRRALETVMMGQDVFPVDLTAQLLSSAPPVTIADRRAPSSASSIRLQPPVSGEPRTLERAFTRSRPATLSVREQQILPCLVQGASNKEIARELDIAEATVKVHVKGLLRKLHVVNRTQIAIWAINNVAGAATDAGLNGSERMKVTGRDPLVTNLMHLPADGKPQQDFTFKERPAAMQAGQSAPALVRREYP